MQIDVCMMSNLQCLVTKANMCVQSSSKVLAQNMADELMSMPLDEAIPLTRACGASNICLAPLIIPCRSSMQYIKQHQSVDVAQGTTSTSHRLQRPITGVTAQHTLPTPST